MIELFLLFLKVLFVILGIETVVYGLVIIILLKHIGGEEEMDDEGDRLSEED